MVTIQVSECRRRKTSSSVGSGCLVANARHQGAQNLLNAMPVPAAGTRLEVWASDLPALTILILLLDSSSV